MVKRPNIRNIGAGIQSKHGVENADKNLPPIKPRRQTFIEQRAEIIEQELAGERIRKMQYKVDPTICRLWHEHGRFYKMLTVEDCQDLIDGFRSIGQQTPAIVRRLDDDPDGYEYEVICGARRLWTAIHTEHKLLIEPQELSDRQAFHVSDQENRDRKDISLYERGLKYHRALYEHHYYETQAQMAEAMGLSESYLSKCLFLPSLDKKILEVFPDPRRITVKHVKLLRGWIKKDEQGLLERAEKIRQRAADGQALADAKTVMQHLAPPPPAKAVARMQFSSKGGKSVLKRERRGDKVTVTLDLSADRTLEDFDALIQAYAEKHGLISK